MAGTVFHTITSQCYKMGTKGCMDTVLHVFIQSDDHLKRGSEMLPNGATLNRVLGKKKNPGCERSENWKQSPDFPATLDISNCLAHSGPRRASKSNDYTAKITM